ncbi:MAG TPA: XRE family transcriptional regulator [Opitutales bacterium]|nr:XRE family transcriptional regulator [Opitutales bacterium]
MNLVFLAQRIREIRKKRILTLEQLAERSQLTQSVLSKVENSRVTPSLSALSRIAAALGVTLSELVEGIDEERPMTVMRHGEAPLFHDDHSNEQREFRSLAPTRHQKRIEPLIGKLAAKTDWQPLPVQNDELFIYVIKGALEIRSGDEKCELKTGDSLYLDATDSVETQNPTSSPAEFLCILTGKKLPSGS